MLNGDGENIRSPLSENDTLIDWSKERINGFRDNCSRHDPGWFESELLVLSPYLLPLPIERNSRTSTLNDFKSQGFATVLRLPLLNSKAFDKGVVFCNFKKQYGD